MNAEQRAAGGPQGPATTGATTAPNDQPAKKKRRPALLYRFPKLFLRRPLDEDWPGEWPVVLESDPHDYRELSDDLTLWLKQLKPRFRRLDHRAQILQNQFWRQNVALIIGGLVATSLGAIQAVLGGGVVGVAVAQAALTGVLAGLTVLIRSRRAQQGYLNARLQAEGIKSEFFMFLARSGDYAGPDPQMALLQHVEDIEAAEDAT